MKITYIELQIQFYSLGKSDAPISRPKCHDKDKVRDKYN